MPLFPPLDPSDPPDTRAKGAPWHVGLMVTQARAIAVASALYPFEFADGGDCRAEHGREGQPCSACAYRNEEWKTRVREVRAAMHKAFA